MSQPSATSTAVPNANSSAPEQRGHHNVARRAQATVGAQAHASSQPVVNQHLLRLGKPSSHGLPAYLMLESGDAPVPPEWPAITM